MPRVQRPPSDDPAAFDAYLDLVLVGGRRPVDRVVLAEPDPAWADRFAVEAGRVAAALGPAARGVDHVGSTAVPGLAAKPVVDLVVTVADPDDEDAYLPALEAAGYELRVREPGHRMLRPADGGAHVHVYAQGDPAVSDLLALRDRLRADEEDRRRYEAEKRRLADRPWPDVNHYAEAKSAVIAEILGRARAAEG